MRKIKGCWFRKKKTKKRQQQLPQFKQPCKDPIITIWLSVSQAALLTREINKHVGCALGWLILAFLIVKGIKALNWSNWIKKRSINFHSAHHVLPQQTACCQLGRGESTHKRANLKNHQNYQCLSVTTFCYQYRYSRHFSSFLNCYPCFISETNRNCYVGLKHIIRQNPTLSDCLGLAHSVGYRALAVCGY